MDNKSGECASFSGVEKKSQELVSVVMPVHNGERFIWKGIESVLSQTHESWELLVVDDASEDATLDVVSRYADPRIRTIRNSRQLGVGESINNGLKHSRGSLVARLDADDFSRKDRFELQVAEFRASPRLGLLGSWIRTFGAESKTIRFPKTDSDLRLALCFRNPFAHSSVMFRALGPGNRPWNYISGPAQDYELWIRIARHYDLANIPEVLTFYRRHDAQVTAKNAHLYPPAVLELQASARQALLVTQQPQEATAINELSLLSFLNLLVRGRQNYSAKAILMETSLFFYSVGRETLGKCINQIFSRFPTRRVWLEVFRFLKMRR